MLKSDGMKLVCTWLASECPIGHPIEITCVVYDENKQHFYSGAVLVMTLDYQTEEPQNVHK